MSWAFVLCVCVLFWTAEFCALLRVYLGIRRISDVLFLFYVSLVRILVL